MPGEVDDESRQVEAMMRSPGVKVVRWSKRKGCFVGSVPTLAINGVCGKSRNEVFAKLHQIGKTWERQHYS